MRCPYCKKKIVGLGFYNQSVSEYFCEESHSNKFDDILAKAKKENKDADVSYVMKNLVFIDAKIDRVETNNKLIGGVDAGKKN